MNLIPHLQWQAWQYPVLQCLCLGFTMVDIRVAMQVASPSCNKHGTHMQKINVKSLWLKSCMREEVTGGWRKLQNDKLCTFYSSPNIIRIMISRMKWTRHVECMLDRKNSCVILVGEPEGKRPLENLCVEGKKIKWILIRMWGVDKI